MKSHDISGMLDSLPKLVISPNMTEDDAAAAMQLLAPFNQCTLGVVRFSGETPWERHPDGDELLHVLDGEVRLTILTDEPRLQATVAAGSIFVVPRGLWHRQLAHRGATLLFATPTEKTENSWAEDPRRET